MLKKISAYYFIIINIAFFITDISAQEINSKSVTFKVSDVKVTDRILEDTRLREAIELHIDKKIVGFSMIDSNKRVVPTEQNGFIESIFFAYSEHRPLIISPDMIWLLICQGFSIHANLNYKSLSPKLVNHVGKKTIFLNRNNFKQDANNPWIGVIDEFTDSIKKTVNDSIYNLVVTNFSTTNITEKIAYKVTLMDILKVSFNFFVGKGCGITSITLEGTLDDWRKIRNDVEKFRNYGLDKWIDCLIPVLDQFVAAYSGKIDRGFWESIYKDTRLPYSPLYITGWIIKFFPYIKLNEYASTENNIYRFRFNPYLEDDDFRLSQLTVDFFPNGISKCPFKFIDFEQTPNKVYSMAFIAGFVGFTQNKETKSVRAEISWAVIDSTIRGLRNQNLFPYGRERGTLDPFRNLRTTGSDSISTDTTSNPTIFPIFNSEKFNNYSDGMLELDKSIKLKIAELKKDNELHGIINVQFIVSWAGNIINIKFDDDIGRNEAWAVKEILRNLPKWKPAVMKFHAWKGDYSAKINFVQKLSIHFD